jgi:hypothetical protein
VSEKQPEALRLACIFEDSAEAMGSTSDDYFYKAAAELRRQHALLAHIGTMLPRPLFDSQCRELCGALGWQGGTYHQVLAEVKRLKESDTSREVASGISRQIKEGGGAWRSCSGCHELNEGHDTGPYSHTFRCALGHGCSECGGIGAVWDTTDYQALAALDHFAAPAEVPMPEAVGTRFDGTKLIKEADARTYGDAREAAGYARAGLSSAAVDVLTERQRQISVEGWTTEHDDRHPDGSLSMAAACYAAQAGTTLQSQEYSAAAVFTRVCWPWAMDWWKPTAPRRDLVKAGALTLAQIERLDRAAQKGGA